MGTRVSWVRTIVSLYSVRFVPAVLYMLQTSGYHIKPFLAWLLRVRDFSHVERRAKLVFTPKVIALFVASIAVMMVCIFWGLLTLLGGNLLGLLAILLYPVVVVSTQVLSLIIGIYAVQKPKERRMFATTKNKIAAHPAKKIAVVGSYGKTSFKETLATVLEEGLHIAASPGNMNTPIGISRFVEDLDGTEDVLIFEFGEEYVGDVKKLAELTSPDYAVITGISEAHLTTFGSIDKVSQTIFEIDDFVDNNHLYKNAESELVNVTRNNEDPLGYSMAGVNGWTTENIQVGLTGTKFSVKKNNKTIWVETKLIGTHQVGPLVAVIDIADRLGLTIAEISDGIGQTKPFEHRMQPRYLHGATIIDDTYNGNSKGVEAGLELLRGVNAKRKIYVTPGLVDQGKATARIHENIGELIAKSGVDEVVLMNNSTTKHITIGLEKGNFQGKLRVVDDPLNFYTHLDQFVANGDVVLLQNDWTDNYA